MHVFQHLRFSKRKPLGSNKSPCLDGLSAEFYKKYKNVLARELSEVLSACLSMKTLPAFWTVANIFLIPKEGKHPSNLGN